MKIDDQMMMYEILNYDFLLRYVKLPECKSCGEASEQPHIILNIWSVVFPIMSNKVFSHIINCYILQPVLYMINQYDKHISHLYIYIYMICS